MASQILISEPMTRSVFELLIRVRQQTGLHINYKYGYPGMPTREMDDVLRPLYDGCTYRVFLYATEATGKSEVKFDHNGQYYAGADRTNDVATLYIGSPAEGHKADKTKHISAGTYYSLAVRAVSDKYIQSAVDDLDSTSLKTSFHSKSFKYKMVVQPGNHTVMSIHISDELNIDKAFPEAGLGPRYFYPGTKAPIGSSYTAVCTHDGARDIKVAVTQENNPPIAVFSKTLVARGEIFVLYIRNHPERWVVHASFDPKPQVFKSAPNKEYIEPSVLEGGIVHRMNYEIMRE